MMGIDFGVSFWAWAAKDPDRTNHRYRAKAWEELTEKPLESMCQGVEADSLPWMLCTPCQVQIGLLH